MKKGVKKIIKNLGFKLEKLQDRTQVFKTKYPDFKDLDNLKILLSSESYIHNLKRKFKDFSIKNYENGFIVTLSNLNIYVESAEELFIINEVFIEEDYKFYTNKKVVVIDIGANIGIASLFFSKLECVDKIYAFEPVKDTFNQAKFNFSLNKKTNKVVSINNYGLGKNNREEVFIFDNNVKGNTGIRGVLSSSYTNNVNTVEVKVEIKDITQELKIIIEDNPNSKIVVKMDCEGAEYEIFENISASKYIDKIDMFMLEWHDKGAEVIETILKNNNFNYFSRSLAPNAGMIYASKANR